MLVLPPKVRRPAGVAPEFNLLKLRYSNAEGILDSPQACLACFFRSLGNLFEEIPAKRIMREAYRPIGFPDELWNDVQIADGLE
jgi:hypothetical protein